MMRILRIDNLFVIVRSIIGGFLYTDGSFLSRLTGLTCWPIYIKAYRGGKRRAKHVLDLRGIPHWGWGYHAGAFFVRVPKDRAIEAEDALRSANFIILKRSVRA